MINFGLGWIIETNGDISALLGFIIQDKFMIGYSYDIPNSDIRQYTTGSHEFMFGSYPSNLLLRIR